MTTRVQSTVTWRFVGKTRRHEVELRHNTISGKQLLTVNGEILHRINWKYKLTGEANSLPNIIPGFTHERCRKHVLGVRRIGLRVVYQGRW